MKNSGMMNPPRQPDDSVTVVPHSLASAATANVPAAALVTTSALICASPKVNAYGDQNARPPSASPPIERANARAADCRNAHCKPRVR